MTVRHVPYLPPDALALCSRPARLAVFALAALASRLLPIAVSQFVHSKTNAAPQLFSENKNSGDRAL